MSRYEELKMLGFVTALLVIVGLAVGVMRFWKGYEVTRDIDALIDRAQVSADSADMLKQMNTLKANMLTRGIDQGHSALIFKTPLTDFSLTYKAVEDLISRLDQVDKLPKNETAYQVALDDIRGTIRELPNPGDGYMWIHYDIWLIPISTIVILIWFTFIGVKLD